MKAWQLADSRFREHLHLNLIDKAIMEKAIQSPIPAEGPHFVNAGLPPDVKLANVVSWFEDGSVVVAKGYGYPGESTMGRISEKPKSGSGIWGYGGDSIAVRINEEYWPSALVTLHS